MPIPITNLGGLAAGYNNYLQQQFENNQKAQYLALLQQEEARKQQTFDQTNQNAADLKEANLQQLFSDATTAPAPQPGQASVPMAMPGATPMPQGAQMMGGEGTPAGVLGSAQRELAAINRDLATKPLDPRSRQMLQEQAQMLQGTIARGGQGQATPDATAPMPRQGVAPGAGAAPAMPAGGNPPQAPQMPQQGAQDPVQASLQILAQTSQQLQTPAAQRIASDSRVTSAQDAFHNYVKELQAQGINPVNGQKPDGVQSARLMLLHAKVDAAVQDAAKSVTEQDKNAAALAKDYVQVWTRHETAMATVKAAGMRLEGQRERGAGAGTPDYDGLSDADKKRVDFLVNAYQTTGKFPTGTGYNDPLKRVAESRLDTGAAQNAQFNLAMNKADSASLSNLIKTADRLAGSLKTFDNNFKQVMDSASKYGLQGTMPMNRVANFVRKQGGSADAAAFDSAVRTVQGEYAKLLTASTSASGSSVESLRRASEMISENMTFDQLKEVQRVLDTDGKNVIEGLRSSAKDVQQRMQSRGKPAADTGGDFKARNGKTYTSQDLQGAADKMGITVDELKQRIGG